MLKVAPLGDTDQTDLQGFAGSQAPAWEFGAGSSSFPSREAGASLSGFPSWSLGTSVNFALRPSPFAFRLEPYVQALYIPSNTNEFGLTTPIILLFSITGALTRL